MTHYIGATGLDIFDDAISDAIEETTNTLTTLINAVATQDNLNAIYSSNYTDTVGDLIGVYSSNYSDKVGVWGSNYTDREITYTSNYVRTTSNILVNRIKLLEGSEGTAGDPSADPPIPPIPPTGNIYILATLGLLTAGATATGILIGDLTIKVNNNAIYGSNYSDKVGVWGSNYARDKIGVYSSNYTDLIGVYSSNYARDKIGVYSSNYTDLIGIYSSNYARDKVGVYSSNYTDLIGVYSSNYARDKIGVYSSNYTDLIGVYSSNYARDKIGVYSSNYTDLIGGYSSNYARDKVGVWGSNYSDKVGVYSSNYTNREITFTSNYVARINTALSGANYWTEESTNNIYLNKSGNVGIGTQTSLTNKLQVQGTISASGLITGNAGLTIPSGQTLTSSGTLTANVINASGLITGNAGLTIPSGQTLTSSGTLTASVINASGLITATQTTTGTNDILNMRYDTQNGIRFTQRYIGVGDVRYDLIQKVANVDKIASLTIYNGNVGIGRTDPTNILQIGSGNRLRIANNNADFTIIGTGDTPELHTRIFMGGINYTEPFYGGTGNLYMFSGNGGKHLFITQTTTTETERMRIGNNGNVAIGTTDTATYKLNVAGDINVSGAFRVGGTALANSWSAGTPATDIYYSAGNVNIGTATSQSSYKLNVSGNTYVANTLVFNNSYRGGGSDYACNKISLYGGVNTPTTTSTYGFGVVGGTLEYFSPDSHRFYTGTTGGTGYGTQRMIMYGNGAVGIHTTSGANPTGFMKAGSLLIGNVDANYGYSTTGWTTGANGTAGLLMECTDYTEIAVHDSGATVASFMTYYNNAFQIGRDVGYGSSKVAIVNSLAIGGNYVAQYSLDIPANGTGNSGYGNMRYFDVNNVLSYSYTYLGNVSARIGGSLWVGSWIASSSDTRIKEDIEDINDDTALNMILAIEPKTYKYIDKVAKGNKKVYGFIAQQIKEVLPDAVGIEPNYIPNIMLLADYDNEIITLPSQPVKVIIKLNDKIRCYDKDNKHIDIVVIEIIDELTFKIKFNDNEPIRAKEPTSNSSNIDIPDSPPKYTDNKIFVSGTEVDDFHTISKEYIFTLNVCATQELHRRIISQEERIKELEGKMKDILKYLSI